MCMQSILSFPLVPLHTSHTFVYLTGCIEFATSEMHLCRGAGRFSLQAVIGLGFKIFQGKSKLRVCAPSRDGVGAIVAPWVGLEAGRNRPKWGRFGGLLP